MSMFDRLFRLRHKARLAGHMRERDWRYRISPFADAQLVREIEAKQDGYYEPIRTTHGGRVFGIHVEVDQNLGSQHVALAVSRFEHAQEDGSVITGSVEFRG